MWELPIIAAVACVWWSLYFLWRFQESGGEARWALLLGAALGLLIGCRIAFLLPAALMLSLAAVPTREGERRLRIAPVLKASLLFGLSGLALLFYNYKRFGHWTEFGTSFQLLGATTPPLGSVDPGYIPFNA